LPRSIDYLKRSLPRGTEDAAEGYRQLTQAYLHLPQPNLEGALAANEQLLALPMDNENLLAPARLERGELLLRLQRREEARQTLAHITPRAPGDIYVRARALRASLCQQDELWPEAQKLWEEILLDGQHPPKDKDQVFYSLGLCQARQGQAAEAETTWEKAMAFNSEPGQAAAFRLADLALHEHDGSRAWKAYERALRDVSSPADFHNHLLDLAEARHLCEEGCHLFGTLGDFDSARKLALAYARLAPPGKSQELLAQAADALAQAALDRSRKASNPGEAVPQEQEARTHFKEAAAAYQAVADLNRGQPAEADWLWRSADRFLQGQDYSHGLEVLKRYLAIPQLPEAQAAQGWFTLAGAYQKLQQDQEVQKALLKCIEVDRSGTYAARARYLLAEAEIKRGKPENLQAAEAILKQNLDLMGLAPDPEAQEKSLLALAGLLYRRHEYRVAAVHLQQVLDDFPAGSHSTMARHVLADCYRRLAKEEEEKIPQVERSTPDAQSHTREQYRRWLGQALENYQKLKEDLLSQQAHAPLSETDAAILREAQLAEILCAFDLGQYADALQLGQKFVDRYPNRPESMVAFKQILRFYWVVGQTETDKAKKDALAVKAREVIAQARAHLKTLDEKSFQNEAETHNRLWWEQWLDWAAKQKQLGGTP
ncbi:MAG: tetratricopeptide repeat protein, partial [Planctomycetes bacterium]|nr:tetratricopeptide repeat protein [Planctomycetota bacterium]